MQKNRHFTEMKKHLLTQVFFLFVVLAIYFFLITPGMSGGFLFDDFPNLEGLSSVSEFGVMGFALDGVSSTLGRPLSLLSFAVQASSWPDRPADFKLVNVLIHAVNGLLVWLLSIGIGRFVFSCLKVRAIFACLAFSIWLLLPIHASTTFYVIQRMTQLSATWSLVALCGVVFALPDSKSQGHPVLATLAMVVGYVLGILCKENAILLSVQALLVIIVLAPGILKSSNAWRGFVALLCLLPMLLLIVYLADHNRYLGGYAIREFNLYERLLTEPRILWDYVFKIVLPTPAGINFYNDDFILSRNLLQPVSTLFALSIWFCVLLWAWRARKRYPLIALGILFFIAGHLLESTVLGLELYFEHRNYLPSLGVVWAVLGTAWCLMNKGTMLGVSFRCRTGIAFAVIWIIWLGTVLRVESDSWRSNKSFMTTALLDRPHSMRARQEAAAFFTNDGMYGTAAAFLGSIEQEWPYYAGNYAQLLLLHCLDGKVIRIEEGKIRERFASARFFERGTYSAVESLIDLKAQGECRDITWENIDAWLNILLGNPTFRPMQEYFVVLRAKALLFQNKPKDAVKALDFYDDHVASDELLLLKTQYRLMAGDISLAENALRIVRSRVLASYRKSRTLGPAIAALEDMLQISRSQNQNTK